jgi:hypothetical protein
MCVWRRWVQVVYAELQAGTLPAEVLERLFVVGGECNYLLRPVPDASNSRLALEFQHNGWKTAEMDTWSDDAISELLDRATVALHTVRSSVCSVRAVVSSRLLQ